MSGPGIYTGPKGTCPDCGQETFVRLGSMVSEVKDEPWHPSDALLWRIYESIASHAGWDAERKRATRKGTQCPACGTENPSKFAWLALDGEKVGEAPEMLAGPFCGYCARAQKTEYEHQDGIGVDAPVYYVLLNDALLTRVCAAVRAKKKSDPEETQGSETEGLF